MPQPFDGPEKPFKTQQEWEEAFEKQAAVVAKTIGITLAQARRRQMALLMSGILEQGNAKDQVTRQAINMFLRDPQWDGPPPAHFSDN